MVLKNIGYTLIGKPMIFFGLRLAAKSTKTSLDDNGVELVNAALENDKLAMEKYAKAILEELAKKI